MGEEFGPVEGLVGSCVHFVKRQRTSTHSARKNHFLVGFALFVVEERSEFGVDGKREIAVSNAEKSGR